jgi:endonuclease YncB( thermonuclease family)
VGAFLFGLPALAAAVECPAERIDEHARVEAVVDGDTLRLDDGRQVRLIGINTPEFGRDGAPDEPMAREAQHALRNFIERGGRRVALRHGSERHDRYGRLLAHPYLPDGRNLTRQLLERGHGLHITVPPNLHHLDCYRRAERHARAAGRGVWSGPRYRGTPAAELPADAGGFAVVSGRIERIGKSERAFWLDLGGLSLRLPKADLPYFDGMDPSTREGQRLRVRGWIYRVDDEARMNLRHPASVEWLNTR